MSETQALDPSSPADIRAAGWAVAIHNDYRLNGKSHTFWLVTKADPEDVAEPGLGRYAIGEGRTDSEALNEIRALIGLPHLELQGGDSSPPEPVVVASFRIPEALEPIVAHALALAGQPHLYSAGGSLEIAGPESKVQAFRAFVGELDRHRR